MEPIIEDVGIYIILIVLIINTIILYAWANKESKKIEEIHKFIENLINNTGQDKND